MSVQPSVKVTSIVSVKSESPVREIKFGEALKLTLDNYYDLLKAQVGGLKSDEFIQLKLVADTLDLSDKKASEQGYKWNSHYRLLQRSDLSIFPTPVSGEIQTALATLSQVYGSFLRRLRSYVVKKVLSPQEQIQLADIDKKLESLKKEINEFYVLDRQNWRTYAELMGYQFGDKTAYVQWSGTSGHLRDIEQRIRQIQAAEFDKKTILDRQYPDPDDRDIVEAEFKYEDPTMRLRYPTYPDFEYPNGDQFDVVYLATLPLGSTALFEDRRSISWDKTLTVIKTAGAGSLSATLDRNTSASSSISTDWNASASGGWAIFSAKASASELTQIEEDFKKGTVLTVSAKAAFKLNIQYPSWFNTTLFQHKRLKENIYDFEDFFGEEGSLLYYPLSMIIVRGFNVQFEASQNWTFDYKRKFSASGGGGFNAFGYHFGASAGYNSNIHEHKVDVSNTKLTIADDDSTLRFAGFTVMRNSIFSKEVKRQVESKLGRGYIDELEG